MLLCRLLIFINFILHCISGKEARKKELKKNKKQRQMVRAAVLKGKDPLQLLVDLEKIDQMGEMRFIFSLFSMSLPDVNNTFNPIFPF